MTRRTSPWILAIRGLNWRERIGAAAAAVAAAGTVALDVLGHAPALLLYVWPLAFVAALGELVIRRGEVHELVGVVIELGAELKPDAAAIVEHELGLDERGAWHG